MLVTVVFTGLGYSAVFALLAALSLVGGCVAVAFGPRTTGVSLEATTTPDRPRTAEKAALS